MNTINAKWLRPMPSYYAAWSYRDDERIAAAPPFVPDPNLPEPQVCECCGRFWQRSSRAGAPALFCKEADCQKEKHRRYWARSNEKRRGGEA